MTEIEKVCAKIGTARGMIERKREQTSDDYFIDGVLSQAHVLLKKQPEIVLCKDCKYWEISYEDYAYGYCWKVSPGHNIVKEATWYCADGKARRNENATD